ncbi:MAG: tRNA (guanosine(18)-2'-O)-methyltransferase TrmH [Bacteroidetes bacterium]|nr:tRNA (guanosine(18)-2'-O)-methyltransferase TrmH [Bacteroidota bacterium]
MRTERRLQKIATVLKQRQPDLTVVMENIHDPHNVSAILRTCDAVGVHQVHLVYTTTEFPDIGKKSSASARKWVERRKHRTIEECFSALRAEGFKILATHLNEKSTDIYNVDFTEKIAIVVGNEHEGVSHEAATLADRIIQIPMFGMIQSLNVSVATAVILYEAARQRLNAGMYSKQKFSDSELQRLIQEWAMKE